jgi:hypothetical protein
MIEKYIKQGPAPVSQKKVTHIINSKKSITGVTSYKVHLDDITTRHEWRQETQFTTASEKELIQNYKQQNGSDGEDEEYLPPKPKTQKRNRIPRPAESTNTSEQKQPPTKTKKNTATQAYTYKKRWVNRFIKREVIIDMQEINPDKDLEPNFTQTSFIAEDENTNMNTIHTKEGRHITNMRKEVTKQLYNKFLQHTMEHPNNTKETFEQELIRLVEKYKAPIKQTNLYNNKWVPTHTLKTALAKTFNITHEIFTNPMERSPDIPNYCSPFPKDKIFGSLGDPYEHSWNGTTSLLCPPRSSEETYKAIKWALQSTKGNKPTLIICAVPCFKNSAARKLLSYWHPRIHLIGSIPKRFLTTHQEGQWALPEDKNPKAHTWETDIFAIGNIQGLQSTIFDNWETTHNILKQNLSEISTLPNTEGNKEYLKVSTKYEETGNGWGMHVSMEPYEIDNEWEEEYLKIQAKNEEENIMMEAIYGTKKEMLTPKKQMYKEAYTNKK